MCIFFNESRNEWSSDGCIGYTNETSKKFSCNCTHLTSFQGVQAPRTVALSEKDILNLNLNNLLKNPITSITLLIIFLAYICVVLGSRRCRGEPVCICCGDHKDYYDREFRNGKHDFLLQWHFQTSERAKIAQIEVNDITNTVLQTAQMRSRRMSFSKALQMYHDSNESSKSVSRRATPPRTVMQSSASAGMISINSTAGLREAVLAATTAAGHTDRIGRRKHRNRSESLGRLEKGKRTREWRHETQSRSRSRKHSRRGSGISVPARIRYRSQGNSCRDSGQLTQADIKQAMKLVDKSFEPADPRTWWMICCDENGCKIGMFRCCNRFCGCFFRSGYAMKSDEGTVDMKLSKAIEELRAKEEKRLRDDAEDDFKKREAILKEKIITRMKTALINAKVRLLVLISASISVNFSVNLIGSLD